MALFLEEIVVPSVEGTLSPGVVKELLTWLLHWHILVSINAFGDHKHPSNSL